MKRKVIQRAHTAMRSQAKTLTLNSKCANKTLDNYFANHEYSAKRLLNGKTEKPISTSNKASSSASTSSSSILCKSPSTKMTEHRGPRTKLPFLQNTVRHALTLPNTINTKTPFIPYPLLPPHANKPPNGSTVLYKDDQCVLVNDAYSKSFVHCLVMPLDLRLVSLSSLNAQHVSLLRHFVLIANEYVTFLKREFADVYSTRRFITGFHALPSLPMLHMHLLTLDLDSPCLKTKKHYNSFATFFFLTSDRVIDDLDRHGRVTLNRDTETYAKMENQDMKCLWCGVPLSTIPAVKSHLPLCPQNKSL